MLVPGNHEYATGVARPRLLTRWWLRSRPCFMPLDAAGEEQAGQELYVPWWAWPFEGMHRLVFGRPQLLEG